MSSKAENVKAMLDERWRHLQMLKQLGRTSGRAALIQRCEKDIETLTRLAAELGDREDREMLGRYMDGVKTLAPDFYPAWQNALLAARGRPQDDVAPDRCRSCERELAPYEGPLCTSCADVY